MSQDDKDKPPKGPWGQRSQPRPTDTPPPRGGGSDPLGLDNILRHGRERFQGNMPQSPRLSWAIAVIAIVAVWIGSTSFYRVNTQERGVLMRFGRYVETTGPGLHFKMPAPVDTVIKPKVEEVRSIDIGAPGSSNENLMLTGDQNIIDIAYAVRWKIKDPELFLFQLAEPEGTVREVAESAMRSEIARATLNDAVGPQRAQIAESVGRKTQEILDSYNAGITILGVDIKQADPPSAVDEAFKDVSAAQQEAQQYLNNARAYAQELVARAQGEAALFDAVYAQYRLAPEVTRKRIYLETMENIMKNSESTIIDAKGVNLYAPFVGQKPQASLPPALMQQSQSKNKNKKGR